jgi:hypothetical protein
MLLMFPNYYAAGAAAGSSLLRRAAANTVCQHRRETTIINLKHAQCAILRQTFVLVWCLRAGTPLRTSMTELVPLCASLIAKTSSPALAACAAYERAPAARRSCLAD